MRTPSRDALARVALLLSIVAAWPADASAAELYDLNVTPSFSAGDVATRVYNQTYRSLLLDASGEALHETLTDIDSTENQTVTALADDGTVAGFREELLSSELQFSLKYAGEVIDGMRLVNVLVSAPGNQPQYLAEMERVVRTLRVFEPTLNGRE